jgi:hypothetical protein
MEGLARFIMRGRLAAIAVVAVSALVPFLLWLSGGALALVTLRRGLGEGALVAGVAAGVLAAAAAAMGWTVEVALQPGLQLWLPLVLLAAWLRYSVSLPRTLELAAGLTALAVVAFYAMVPNPTDYWTTVFGHLRQLMGGAQVDPQAWQALVDSFAPVMTGLWGVNLLGVVVISLVLGRWWQALLYNPGGFRQEFHGLRLETWYAAVALVLLGGGAMVGPGLLYDLALVVTSVFTLQALAVAHNIVARRGWSSGWLVGVYLVLPLALRAVAIVGIIDVFVDLRRRAAGPMGPA